MKRCLLMFVLLFTACSFGQTIDATMSVNGATDPNGIPDDNAYLMVFREMAAQTTITLTQKVALVGFSDPDDATNFQNEMVSFTSQDLGAQSGGDSLALAIKFEGQIRNVLTGNGYSQLYAFVVSKKYNMALWTANATGLCQSQQTMMRLN